MERNRPPIVGAMTTEPQASMPSLEDSPTVLGCDECEVTWRDHPGAPCWFCGSPGHVIRPERLVLD